MGFYVKLLRELKITSVATPDEIPWLFCSFVVAAIDGIAALLLLLFAGYHVSLVLTNRTSLGGDEEEADRFHVGWHGNWCQVFGTRRALWLLPLLGSGPSADGLEWPENPNYVPSADEEVGAYVGSREHLAATSNGGIAQSQNGALAEGAAAADGDGGATVAKKEE